MIENWFVLRLDGWSGTITITTNKSNDKYTGKKKKNNNDKEATRTHSKRMVTSIRMLQ